MAAQDLNNSFRLNLDNRRPLEVCSSAGSFKNGHGSNSQLNANSWLILKVSTFLFYEKFRISKFSLKNRKLCPEYSHHSRFTHAPELIPFKVAGSTSAGAAIIRLDRPSGANVLDETDNYRTISNDYDTEQHQRVERIGFRRILFPKTGCSPVIIMV